MAGVEYEPEMFCNTHLGMVQMTLGRRMGDANLDADIEFVYFGASQRCFDPAAQGVPENVRDECQPFDFDRGNDVARLDYAAFQQAFGTTP